MPRYQVRYNGPPEIQATPETYNMLSTEMITRIQQEEMDEYWQELQVAKVLQGMTILTHTRSIGTCCLEGSEEQFQRLNTFLERKRMGAVLFDAAKGRVIAS